MLKAYWAMDSNAMLGKLVASREYAFADGVNVRNLLRDLGMLVLWNSEQDGYDLDDFIRLVGWLKRQIGKSEWSG